MIRPRLRLALLLTGFFAIGLATPPLSAQMPEVPPGKWWKRPRVVQILKLQPEQQERLDTIFARNRRSFIDLKADLEKRQIDLEDLLNKKESDAKKVAAASEAVEEARGRLRRAWTMMFVEMRDVLTNEQWRTFLAKTEDWRRERREERPERPGLRRRGAGRENGSDPADDGTSR